MKYSTIVSLVFYLCGCFYMLFGLYAVLAKAKSNINRQFLIMTSSMAIWAFSYSVSNSAPTAEDSAFWRSFAVFGWVVFYSLLLHFVLLLTENKNRYNTKLLVAIYLPAVINLFLFSPFGFYTKKMYNMVLTDSG